MPHVTTTWPDHRPPQWAGRGQELATLRAGIKALLRGGERRSGSRASPRFAAEFSGTDRTVAEYLLAEVLERQPEEVRRLLLRTSILERVSGPLADVLTGASGGERILQDLEQAGAFVSSLDASRSWFRYHRLFADLLRLELRRTEPGELPALHAAAAGWRGGQPGAHRRAGEGDLIRGALADVRPHLGRSQPTRWERCPRTAADACRSC